jgi:hypothetical protein
VADTIGLCDTEMNDETVFRLIKGRIDSSFKFIDPVYIVYPADRMHPNVIKNITKILNWLNYYKNKNDLRFQFVGTKSDLMKEDDQHLADML